MPAVGLPAPVARETTVNRVGVTLVFLEMTVRGWRCGGEKDAEPEQVKDNVAIAEMGKDKVQW